jgi:hypothetical protein
MTRNYEHTGKPLKKMIPLSDAREPHYMLGYGPDGRIMIEGPYSNWGNDMVGLQPQEALRLLAWLEQERDTLQTLPEARARSVTQ